MKKAAMAASLFLVLAVAGHVVADPQDPKATVLSKGDDKSVVAEERAVLVKLGPLLGHYVVSPTGHVTELHLEAHSGKDIGEVDLNPLSGLSELARLEILQAPKGPRR